MKFSFQHAVSSHFHCNVHKILMVSGWVSIYDFIVNFLSKTVWQKPPSVSQYFQCKLLFLIINMIHIIIWVTFILIISSNKTILYQIFTWMESRKETNSVHEFLWAPRPGRWMGEGRPGLRGACRAPALGSPSGDGLPTSGRGPELPARTDIKSETQLELIPCPHTQPEIVFNSI